MGGPNRIYRDPPEMSVAEALKIALELLDAAIAYVEPFALAARGAKGRRRAATGQGLAADARLNAAALARRLRESMRGRAEDAQPGDWQPPGHAQVPWLMQRLLCLRAARIVLVGHRAGLGAAQLDVTGRRRA